MRSYRPHLEERDPFEAMTSRTAPSLDRVLAEVFHGFPQLQGKCQEICAQPLRYHPDVTLGTSGLWLGTRTGTGGIATLA